MRGPHPAHPEEPPARLPPSWERRPRLDRPVLDLHEPHALGCLLLSRSHGRSSRLLDEIRDAPWDLGEGPRRLRHLALRVEGERLEGAAELLLVRPRELVPREPPRRVVDLVELPGIGEDLRCALDPRGARAFRAIVKDIPDLEGGDPEEGPRKVIAKAPHLLGRRGNLPDDEVGAAS